MGQLVMGMGFIFHWYRLEMGLKFAIALNAGSSRNVVNYIMCCRTYII